MTRPDTTAAEERRLVDTINRMSRQIHFSNLHRGTSSHSKFLTEVIEHLEDQLESIRKNRQVSSHA